jgi:hypothetical protein
MESLTFDYAMPPVDEDIAIAQVPLSEYDDFVFPNDASTSMNDINGPVDEDIAIAQVPLSEYDDFVSPNDASASMNDINGPVVADKENFTDSTGMHLLFFLLYLSECSNKAYLQESLTSGVSSVE